ncbi:MAG: DNA gyrase subunit A, partial [Ureaplasma sp.]|nr:DNA gyrase subunit A [Ureaplasma sp.]
NIIIDKLDYFKNKYGDDRRTQILYGVSGNVDDESLIEKSDILITQSAKGWFKRVPVDTYRTQNRGGVGVVGAKTHSDDSIEKIVISNTHADLLFFTNLGKVYRIRGHQVPVGSRISKGVPAQNFLNIEKNERVQSIITLNDNEYEEEKYLFFITKNGVVKRTSIKEFEYIRNNGKIAITLRDNDELFNVHITNGQTEVFIGSSSGRAVRFNENKVRPMGRTAAGVNGIDLEDKYIVVGSGTTLEGNLVLSIGENGIGKLSDYELYRLSNRGAKGVITLKVNERTGNLVGMLLLNEDDEVLLIANSGNIIRLKVSKISVNSRNASGVKIMNLDKNEHIKSQAAFNPNY